MEFYKSYSNLPELDVSFKLDEEGEIIAVGKGRYKEFYDAELKDGTNVVVTDYPLLAPAEDKPHVFKVLGRGEYGLWIVEKGYTIDLYDIRCKLLMSTSRNGLEERIHNLPQVNKDRLVELYLIHRSQLYCSIYETAASRLWTNDAFLQYLIVPSDHFRLKRIDLDAGDDEEECFATDLGMLFGDTTLIHGIEPSHPLFLPEGPSLFSSQLDYIQTFFDYFCSYYGLKKPWKENDRPLAEEYEPEHELLVRNILTQAEQKAWNRPDHWYTSCVLEQLNLCSQCCRNI